VSSTYLDMINSVLLFITKNRIDKYIELKIVEQAKSIKRIKSDNKYEKLNYLFNREFKIR
jgi:hypothetical protein